MDSTEIATEVPEPLKKLLKYVMRAFYTIEEMLIIDMLLKHKCMKEEDLSDFLKLDKKQMGISIKRLKNDQFIKTRMKMEYGDDEKKITKHNYYFIHYTGFVNVVKYKLDHIRRKLEMQERDSTSRASFKCLHCQKTYTDLEADHLFDMNTGTFKCMMCSSEMEEQQSSDTVQNARALVAKFNEQIEKLYDLLHLCDKFRLSHHILEPAPRDVAELAGSKKSSSTKTGEKSANSSGNRVWSGDLSRNMEFGVTAHSVDVKVGDKATTNQPAQPKREQPTWLTKSTIDGVDNSTSSSLQTSVPSKEAAPAALSTTDSNIMNTLLVHESKSAAPGPLAAAAYAAAAHSDKSDDSDMEELVTIGQDVQEMGDSDDEEIMVSVGDRKVAIHKAALLVEEMTDEQRDEYNRLASSLYSDMYE
ncbi:GTF2E1 [Bugula neritina]|uniref:GTF2E1 n=1 Tax=Bugula neritina TaxID=10212 RepID=A0A7J7IV53_BUGNE|nr:GTF2E1 [Bugula neritina]